jgi:hypothetical protein
MNRAARGRWRPRAALFTLIFTAPAKAQSEADTITNVYQLG